MSFFPGEHTGDNIAQEMRGALADWDLKEDQQVCVTTDNASNMIKALEVNGWMRLQCFGHRLHLAIGTFCYVYLVTLYLKVSS